MKTSTRQQQVIDGIALLLMRHESWRVTLNNKRKERANKKQLQAAAEQLLTVTLGRKPTAQEVELAVFG